MRIAIVDDQILALEALRRVLTTNSEYRIAWIAKNGKEALDNCEKDLPDLILMDLVMPVMNGVEATKLITEKYNCPILIVTSTIKDSSSRVFDAMGYGALDVVCTPNLGSKGKLSGGADLLKKIEKIRQLLQKAKTDYSIRINELQNEDSSFPLIVIGSSTGGPKALAEILSKLPMKIDTAIVIVQHVDSKFAIELSGWLRKQTMIPLNLIEENMQLKKNNIYLAASDKHLIVGADLNFHYISEPEDYPFKPSIDVFFRSLKNNWNRKGVAAILTGMGRDGASGLLLLKKEAWYTIAQNEESSVIFGMPKAAIALGAANAILPIDLICEAMLKKI